MELSGLDLPGRTACSAQTHIYRFPSFRMQRLVRSEAVETPLEGFRMVTYLSAETWIRNCQLLPGTLGPGPLDVMDRISEYTARRLAFDSDTLDAVSSVLNACSEANLIFEHGWGVPIMHFKLFTSKGAWIRNYRAVYLRKVARARVTVTVPRWFCGRALVVSL
ncbi:uncharacterized protein BDZ99DRAFT_299493 [Mytilinidion resinicola]|uniref:Uncharacterized protein n=1 Tax=Mytilinidion resinicola TaxID=574789 RepID=A0A6A6YLZ8_9PEZI|nr:uncharacterized protein BDZ99DRAFT_299493 [Mytilinidion resinicola]KAF2809902.1 hypothetical protein BDZ99DRAFT_299493 [Mytilinidion resinicola]